MGRSGISSAFAMLALSKFLLAQNIKKTFKDVEKQLSVFYPNVVDSRMDKIYFPRSMQNDFISMVSSDDWTSGFWPGILWFMYEYTGKQEWGSKAEEFTSLMEKEPWNASSHNVGFKVCNSYVNGYRLTHILNPKTFCPLFVASGKEVVSFSLLHEKSAIVKITRQVL